MVFDVIISRYAQEQLREYGSYLMYEKMNSQAADALMDDVIQVVRIGKARRAKLNYLRDRDLRTLGYKKIRLRKHRYLFIFRIQNDVAYIDAMYHELQDYENLFKEEVLWK